MGGEPNLMNIGNCFIQIQPIGPSQCTLLKTGRGSPRFQQTAFHIIFHSRAFTKRQWGSESGSFCIQSICHRPSKQGSVSHIPFRQGPSPNPDVGVGGLSKLVAKGLWENSPSLLTWHSPANQEALHCPPMTGSDTVCSCRRAGTLRFGEDAAPR